VLLRTQALTKTFGSLRAVDGVDLVIQPGSLHAIIGPNGAGKSTFFNVLTGFFPADSGSVIFKDQEITRLPPHVISRRGVVRAFQRATIFQTFTVFENVQTSILSRKGKTWNLFGLAAGMLREETLRILETLGLADQADVRAGHLSHGDLKRLEIGIALGMEPELLLLDEPTAGMSPEETVAQAALMQKLVAKQGLNILFTEHDMEVVFGIAKWITVMHQGRVIADGRPDEVRRDRHVQAVYLGEEL
jgi:branched-chain amino acid transport system ATP-binding protein